MIDRYAPEYWLSRAVEARTIADMFTDERTQATMLRIAQAYERMAQIVRQMEAGLALLEKHSSMDP